MSSSCRICKFWSYENKIAVNTFVEHRLIYNIANLFQMEGRCDNGCTRICCQKDIRDFIHQDRPDNQYQKIIDDALDLSVYYPNLYAKAIIAESKLEQTQLCEQILIDPIFDNSLNLQKLQYLKQNKDQLNRDEIRSLELLEFQSKYDNFSYKYKRIFGNKLQVLVLGIMNTSILEDMLSKYYGRRIENQIISFLQPEAVEKYISAKNDNIRYIAYAKLPVNKKLKTLHELKYKSVSIEKEKILIAICHDLPQEHVKLQLAEILQNNKQSVSREIFPQSVIIKLLSQIKDSKILLDYLDFDNPYILGSVIYLLSTGYPDLFSFEKYSSDIRVLIEDYNIFIPLKGVQQLYYEILMDNPDLTLAGFLINYLNDFSLLNKLKFHTTLRSKINERMKFLKLT